MLNPGGAFGFFANGSPWVRKFIFLFLSSLVALFILWFYRKIAQLAMVSLQTRGWLYFEINEYLSKEMDVLLKDIGFANIEIKKDFIEVPRMIKCQKL